VRVETYYAFTKTSQESDARARFKTLFGIDADEVIVENGLLLAGPVPEHVVRERRVYLRGAGQLAMADVLARREKDAT